MLGFGFVKCEGLEVAGSNLGGVGYFSSNNLARDRPWKANRDFRL